MSDEAFAWYFAGLFDGEGCLSLAWNRSTGKFLVRVKIKMRPDSEPLLRVVAERTKVGKVTREGDKVGWTVCARDEVRTICGWMAKHPGLGNKYSEQLALLVEALDILDARHAGGGDLGRLMDLHELLSDLKENPDVGPRYEVLTCSAGHSWERRARRGRKPARCPEHSALFASKAYSRS